jgi:hypothetical protein
MPSAGFTKSQTRLGFLMRFRTLNRGTIVQPPS